MKVKWKRFHTCGWSSTASWARWTLDCRIPTFWWSWQTNLCWCRWLRFPYRPCKSCGRWWQLPLAAWRSGPLCPHRQSVSYTHIQWKIKKEKDGRWKCQFSTKHCWEVPFHNNGIMIKHAEHQFHWRVWIIIVTCPKGRKLILTIIICPEHGQRNVSSHMCSLHKCRLAW